MPLYARVRTCSICDSPNHDRRTCPHWPPSPPPPVSVVIPPTQQEIAAAQEERQRFAAFKAAEDARKEEERREAAAAEAAAAVAKLEEQANAIASFKSQIERHLNVHYAESDEVIIRNGKLWKITHGAADYAPHEWIRLWRELRYSGRVARRLNASEPQPGFDYFDGWPTKDEADVEVHKIAAAEWEKWISFCIRFAERSS